MSKRILVVVLALGMLSASSAFANRARLSVMGTGDGDSILGFGGTTLTQSSVMTNGSFYVDDAYNMFYNPAYINDYGSMAVIEKGQQSTQNIPAAGTSSGPMGGFTMGMGMVKMGLFFNRAQSIHPLGATLRPIDLILGTEMGGAKVGLGVTYASQKFANTTAGLAAGSDEDFTNTALKVSLGVSYMGFEPFGYFQFIGSARGSANFTTGQDYGKVQAYGAGFRYKFGEWVPYFAVRKATSTSDRAAGAAESQATDRSAWGLGIGRNMAVAEGIRFNYALSVWSSSMALAYTGTGSTYQSQNAGRFQVPLDVSAEADVTSWLTVRGGVMYRFIDQANTNATFTTITTRTGSLNDSTSARFGAGFKLGKLELDWTIGGMAITGGTSSSSIDSTTFGLDSGFFTNAAVTYRM